MKKTLLLSAIVAALGTTLSASPWAVRLRSTYVKTVDHSDAFGAAPANDIHTSDKLIPEFDITYDFTDTITAELVLTVPQEHSVKSDTLGPLGNFKELPPTFLLQYRACPGSDFRPYVGAGVNFTLIFDDHLANQMKLEPYSVGIALQAGFDYKLTDKISLNVDVKYAQIRSDVKTAGGAFLTEARLDPMLYAIGLRYEF